MDSCSAFETSFLGSAVGYNITAMAVLVAFLCMCAVAYIFASLMRSIREEHFSLYLTFCLLSAFTLLLAVVQRLLPPPSQPATSSAAVAYQIGLNVFLGFVISLQWFVQTGAVFFLLVRNPGDFKLWRVFLAALVVAVVLLIPWVVSLVAKEAFIGELIDEATLVAFFASSLMLTNPSFRAFVMLPDFFLHPRPMMQVWSSFMLVAHLLFLTMYAVRGVSPGEAGSCLYIVIDSLYYTAYAPVLMFVIRRDSRFWQEHGALLLDMQLVIEDDNATGTVVSHNGKGTIAGVPLIRFAALEFKRKIGTGGFAEVYLANWNDANVAVKVFRIARGQLETMNELLKEARIMYSLSHPNVLQLLGIAMRGKRVKKEAEERPREEEVGLLVNDNEYAEDMLDLSNQDVILCSVLRFAAKGSVFEWIHNADCELPLSRQLAFLKNICAGMMYLHAEKVIHRDLKSANVLLDSECRCMISDFGLSKVTNTGTQTMSAIGTPHYMAPEILRGDRYSASADVWAFGVIVFELAERRVPYQGMSGIVIMQRVAHEGLRVEISREHALWAVMEACLAPEPHERPSFAGVWKLLAQVQV